MDTKLSVVTKLETILTFSRKVNLESVCRCLEKHLKMKTPGRVISENSLVLDGNFSSVNFEVLLDGFFTFDDNGNCSRM